VAGRLFDIEPQLLLVYSAAPARRPGLAAARIPEPLIPDGFGAPAPGNKLSNSVGYLLSVLAVRPEACGRVLGILDPADLDEDDRAAFLRLVSALERGGLEGLDKELVEFTSEEQALVRRAWAAPPPAVQDEVVDEIVRRIRRQARRRRALVIIDRLTEAERCGDRAQVEALEAQLNELRERS
jgi:hypothetical protein